MAVVVVVAETRVEPFAKSAALVRPVGRELREHRAPASRLRVVYPEFGGGGKRVVQKFAHERDLHRRIHAYADLRAAFDGGRILGRDRWRGVKQPVGALAEKVLVKKRDFAQERPRTVAKKRAVSRPKPVVPVERGNPRSRAGPVYAVRLEVALEPAAIAHVERQNEPAAAPEPPSVRSEVFLPAVEQVEKRQQRLGHSAAKRLPVHHRDIFVKEVRRAPCRRIVAVPDALEVCGARAAETRGREEKVAPEVSHLLDKPRIRCLCIGVEQETFVRLARRIRRAEGERRRAEALRELRGVAREKRVERATLAELRERCL